MRLLLALGLGAAPAVDAAQTVGLFVNQAESYRGYTLFSPFHNPATYLIDNAGNKVHEWPGYTNHDLVYLTDDGLLLRTAWVDPAPNFQRGIGRIELCDWDGTVVWGMTYSDANVRMHHDVQQLPSGNLLFIAWEYKDQAEALAAGRDPALLGQAALWVDHLVEVEPSGTNGGNIVWEWHVWDHLVQEFDPAKANYGVVAEHPELIHLNFAQDASADWNHSNTVAYNPDLDQVMVTVRQLSEVWVIDHSTTTAEAAGHSGGRYGKGGDLLYRWGNPEVYDHGTWVDKQLFYPHDAHWVPPGEPGAGNIVVFNNGPRPSASFSTIDEWLTPVLPGGDYAYTPGAAYAPAAPLWTYQATPRIDFYSQIISGAQRLPNGNTLVVEGLGGRLFEVTPDARIVWEYVNPVTDQGPLIQGEPVPPWSFGRANNVHRIRRYPPDHPGLAGRDLTPIGPIERYPLLRNTDVSALRPLTPPRAQIFTGVGATTLDPVRDLHVAGFAAGDRDDDPQVCGASPLIFYQLERDSSTLKLVKDSACAIRALDF